VVEAGWFGFRRSGNSSIGPYRSAFYGHTEASFPLEDEARLIFERLSRVLSYRGFAQISIKGAQGGSLQSGDTLPE
jgi:hypothetical protein